MLCRAEIQRTVVVVALLTAASSTSALARELRAADTRNLPFPFRSIEHVQNGLDGRIGGEFPGSFEPYGFAGIAFHDSGARSICNDVRPVRSLADFESLHVRVRQSGQMTETMRAPGATPVELPYGQVLTGFATRPADGPGKPASARLIEDIRKVE